MSGDRHQRSPSDCLGLEADTRKDPKVSFLKWEQEALSLGAPTPASCSMAVTHAFFLSVPTQTDPKVPTAKIK